MFIIIIFIAFVLANTPWFTHKLLVVFPLKKTKTIPLILVEVLFFYFAVGLLVTFLETQVIGDAHSQGWEFYVVTFFLFIVFSSPGFIYRIVWK